MAPLTSLGYITVTGIAKGKRTHAPTSVDWSKKKRGVEVWDWYICHIIGIPPPLGRFTPSLWPPMTNPGYPTGSGIVKGHKAYAPPPLIGVK